MKLATIGWNASIEAQQVQDAIGHGPEMQYILHPESGGGPGLDDLVIHVRDTQPELVVLDGDAFRELVDCVEAFRNYRNKRG